MGCKQQQLSIIVQILLLLQLTKNGEVQCIGDVEIRDRMLYNYKIIEG